MVVFNEKVFIEDVELYFNEEDQSVGMYCVAEIDDKLVIDFMECFEIHQNCILSYSSEELRFVVLGNTYQVFISSYNGDWKVERI